MAATVLPYSAARFSARPSLSAAARAFAPRKEEALPTLVALIHRAGLAEVAGVALLHAHFDMDDDERLVQRAPVRTPLTVQGQALHAHRRSAYRGLRRVRRG